jgi:D-sedoheptulose 7-phosphate isomerase
VVSQDRITPHTEGMCAVVWHLLVSHPALKVRATKWESAVTQESQAKTVLQTY